MTGFLHVISRDIPASVWLIAIAQVVLTMAAALLLRRRRPLHGATKRGYTLLLVAALGFCSVVLVAFVVGTYEGSTAFAQDRLGWTDWRKVVPWATLDAAGFGFGLFWIRARFLRRSPVRPRRVVYLCAGFSAFLQMTQGGQLHRWQAGLFLAFLAAIGGLILHTVVDQLRAEEGDDSEWHRMPPFGLRWITYLPNTLCAWLAWINHPPVDGTKPTVGNALANLDRVRAGKTSAAAGRLLDRRQFPRWTALAPWVRGRIMLAALDAVRADHGSRLAEHLAERESEQGAALARSSNLERQLALARAAAEQEVERLRRGHAEQVEQIRAEHAERLAAIASERATERAAARARSADAEQVSAAPEPAPKGAEQRVGAQRMSDADAIEKMLAEHPEHDYEWGSREVHRLTGAGFSRIPKLIAAVAEHHRQSGPERVAGAARSGGTERIG